MIVSLDDSIFCRVYVGRAVREDVAGHLLPHFSAGRRSWDMRSGTHEIEVRRSPERWREEEMIDFTHWQVHVELYGDHDDPSGFIELTATVLKLLWGQGYPAIAACDFEHELPWSGGIQSPAMPPERF